MSRVESREAEICHLAHARGSMVVCSKSTILRKRSGRWTMDDGRDAEICHFAHARGRGSRVESRDAEIRHLAHARESRVVCAKSAILRMRSGRWTMDVTPKSAIFRMRGGRGWRVVTPKSAIFRMRGDRGSMDDGREAEPPSCSGVNGRVIEILGFAGKNTQSDTRLR